MPRVFKIVPTTQKYDWGKIGLSSKVAQYAAAAKIPGFTLDEKAPYAELWMGTHPNGPSLVAGSDTTLAEYLAAHPELMGSKVVSRFRDAGAEEGNLPFLFKVLAIEKALSIQTHPDKKTAEALHNEKPNIYKDANHKPEMALALTPFTAMCGFLPLSQIAGYLVSTLELAALIPKPITTQFLSAASSADSSSPEAKTALKDLFSALMTADEATFKARLADLVKRYEAGGATEREEGVKDLVLRLNSQFPGDIGVFCAFVLNYVKMQPGEAIFLAAGEPHAYVSGDIMECMATSDNVIRAGLTPKLRDIPNLVSGLTYGAGDPSRHMVKPAAFDSAAAHTALYDPPIPEFSVLQVLVPGGQTEAHPPIEGPSIAIVTEGKGALESAGEKLEVAEGDVVFIGAGTGVKLVAAERGQLAIYRAFVEAS
ncbi:mannose-6-phosphate isomerase [Rhodofomes roseus]|uniref:Mannose-6-phosphate isomerase n=1 Tax=Rhodofomes roseus TaxID=34475 RepID=A0ABQ8JZM2_9APHY|nr:mannose-6-phosphate isomerase [Rhodofomes roseus]KAH9829839.1 mannose-6-phosphate isomerase [Rhodofomes roseus]